MKPFRKIFEIKTYAFDASKRGHRFRCQVCSRIIQDGGRVVVERRAHGAHGYHGECWDKSLAAPGLTYARAAMAREAEYIEGQRT